MIGSGQIPTQTLDWLLGKDMPGTRYLALRNVMRLPEHDSELQKAREEAHRNGPIAQVLENMQPDGFWVRPGAGYNPKYRSAVWSLILLAQMGASIQMDERIKLACNYMLDHSLTKLGQFSANGTPSETIDCLQGNICYAMLELGCNDPRLVKAFDWMARSVTGEGIAPITDRDAEERYYAYKCGPVFACGVNGKSACAWGAVKVMLAFSRLPKENRTPAIDRAIKTGVDFLFSVDPFKANYPVRVGDKPSRNWWKFGFPVFYITDLLQNVEALASLGYGEDPRLKNSVNYIQSRQDEQGRWPLEYEYNGKTWIDSGAKGQPSKWVTIRALKVLQECNRKD